MDALGDRSRGNPATLEVRKIHRLREDAAAKARVPVRVIDESGEDYMYLSRAGQRR